MASLPARKAILEQSDKQIQAVMALLVGLDQRLTQMASFMLAAAAVSAGFAYQVRDLAFLAGIASTAFAIAGAICFHGMSARSIILPGLRPSAWTNSGELSELSEEDVCYQIAGLNEDIISTLIEVKMQKAAAVNLSLRYGIAGGILMGFSGCLALFR